MSSYISLGTGYGRIRAADLFYLGIAHIILPKHIDLAVLDTINRTLAEL